MDSLTSELTLRGISSPGFIIKTKEIRELEERLLSCLSTTACGAIIYGRPRIGKTRAMMSVAEGIRAKYGDGFPVVMWDITDHAITEKNFYTSLLMAMGIGHVPGRPTALALKERVLNELAIAAYRMPFKKAVIMLDEAWKLSEKDFSWLMDLYNILSRKDILLTCFLFGTRELKDAKEQFKKLGKDQIVGRFMVNEFQFHGMREAEELKLCLMAMDRMTVQTQEGATSVPVSDAYFPNREGAEFFGLGDDYWKAFMQAREDFRLKSADVPMKYFIDSFILLLQDCGACGENPAAFPGYGDIYSCIRKSGYGESDDEYENSKRHGRQPRRY